MSAMNSINTDFFIKINILIRNLIRQVLLPIIRGFHKRTKIGDIVIIAKCDFPCICRFLFYLDQMC